MTECTHPLGHEWAERVFTVTWETGALRYGIFRVRGCVRCHITTPPLERDPA